MKYLIYVGIHLLKFLFQFFSPVMRKIARRLFVYKDGFGIK